RSEFRPPGRTASPTTPAPATSRQAPESAGDPSASDRCCSAPDRGTCRRTVRNRRSCRHPRDDRNEPVARQAEVLLELAALQRAGYAANVVEPVVGEADAADADQLPRLQKTAI